MIGERILAITRPEQIEEAPTIEVPSGAFTLHFGGIRKSGQKKRGLPIEHPFNCRQINAVYTDEETVYIFLENSGLIKFGWLMVSGDGFTEPSFFFEEGEKVDLTLQEFVEMEGHHSFIHQIHQQDIDF